MSPNEVKSDICIIGGGLVGKTAALKLAQTGSSVILCAPKSSIKDQRTTALLMQTVAFFEGLEMWDELKKQAFPLKTMRIVDGTNRLIRAPQTDFQANEINLDAFGYNLKNSDILETLENRISDFPNITQIEGVVKNIKNHGARELVMIETAEETIEVETGFIVGADGRNSIVRSQTETTAREWQYPQAALVVDFKHERSTQFTSTEFHTESGPFTIVPHSNYQAGLVWMEKPEVVETLLLLSKQEMEQTIERKMQSFLGEISLLTKPQSFPLKGMVANQFGSQNWVLVGEAAHVFPPIGAQGFNLGVRDIEAISEVLSRYTNQEDRGGKYHKARSHDINTRTYGVDMLNRSLLSDFLPVQMIRGIGLNILGSIKPLRKYVMKMGISPNL